MGGGGTGKWARIGVSLGPDNAFAGILTGFCARSAADAEEWSPMSPATASSTTRTPTTIPSSPAERAADRVIEIDAGEPVRHDDPAPTLTTARLEQLARVIRLR